MQSWPHTRPFHHSGESPLLLGGLALAAALYFSLSCTVTLEWVDEGQLVYQSWLVSQGAVPHREFQHVYGPAMYLLNGLLFRIFGSDLLVIRLSLVALKAIISVLVYLAARRVASPLFALLAFVSTVIVWGGPWWVFNTPYASHYALALVLFGMLLYLRNGGRSGALLAGVCCGLAAAFKQTTGLFALLSLALCLVWDATASVGEASTRSRVGQSMRLLAVLGSAAICAGYAAAGNTWWNVVALFGPFAAGIAWIGAREIRHGATAGVANIDALLGAGTGMAAPLLLCITGYAAMGLLGNLVESTVSGLPQVIKWFFPVAAPDVRSSLLALAACCPIAGVYLLSRRRLSGYVVLAIGALAGAIAVLSVVRSSGIMSYLQQDAWIGDVFRVVFVLPFLLVWIAWAALLRSDERITASDADPAAPRARVVLTLVAASSLLSLYPAADFWHLLMVWPMIAPLLAWQLERALRGPDGRLVPLAVVVAGVLALVCAAPFLHAVVMARVNRPAKLDTFARATRISDGSQKLRDALAVVRYLEAQPADRKLLSFGEGQMLYFLAGRRSVLEHEEFAFYLVGTGFVADADARVLVPQPRAIARIAETQPIIVTVDGAPFTARLRGVFAELAQYIDAHYQTAATFGPYRVLRYDTQG